MIDDLNIVTPPGVRSRRRRVRKTKRVENNLPRKIRNTIAVAVWGGVAIYAGIIFWNLRSISHSYGDMALGLPFEDLHYQLGNPTRVEQGGQRVTFDDRHRRIVVQLNAERRIIGSSCEPSAPNDLTCPLVGTVGIGSTESEVMAELGVPSSAAFDQGAKVLTYDGLGYAFVLGRGLVLGIRHSAPRNSVDTIKNYVWSAIP